MNIVEPQDGNAVKNILKGSGLSVDQAKKIAKQKGLTTTDISKEAKKRGLNIEKELNIKPEEINSFNSIDIETQKNIQSSDVLNINESSSVTDDINENNSEEESYNEISQGNQNLLQKLDFFGYRLFKGDPSSFQKSNFGSVDPNYNIGSGDEIIIMLWGETEFRQQFTVDREGFVFIPEVGQVFVNGLNLGELEDKISKILSKFYSSLNPVVGKPSTFLDVSLGKLRPLRVMVLGDVAQPGSYTISPTTTLFSSLYYFGGPTFQGSLRDIHLIRNGKKISSIDFYDYLLSGHSKNDVRLQLDDVIFIPKRGKTVSISGEINRPGIYELKTGENLNNLIEIASGLKATTYLKHAQIDRIVPATERDTAGMDRMILDLELGEIISGKAEGLLFDGDKIKLFSILDVRGNVATISGASISRPGIYEIEDSTTVRDLILKADSLLGDVYVGRADIVRLREDLREEIIKIDLEKVLMRDSKHNLLLKPFDRVEIYSMSQMRPIYKVSIMGHVKLGGLTLF